MLAKSDDYFDSSKPERTLRVASLMMMTQQGDMSYVRESFPTYLICPVEPVKLLEGSIIHKAPACWTIAKRLTRSLAILLWDSLGKRCPSRAGVRDLHRKCQRLDKFTCEWLGQRSA